MARALRSNFSASAYCACARRTRAQTLIDGGGFEIVLASDLEVDGQGFAVQFFRLGVLALLVQITCEVVATDSGIGMLIASDLDTDDQGLAVVSFLRFGELSLLVQVIGEVGYD